MFDDLFERRINMKRILVTGLVLLAMAAFMAAAQPGFGQLYDNGSVVRTVVPPAANPQTGTENLYAIMGGVAEQLAVVATAPGAPGYRGGNWAFHSVTWNTTPYLLTSEAEVLAAQGAGDVTIQRVAANDFKCPIQP
jgi:hypothetical protein